MEARTPDGPQADLQLVAHPRAKSKVWKYFGFDADAEGCILHWKRISCRICRAQIAYSGNTSNLSYHLEKNHPAEFCELVRSNTEHMREAFASTFSKLRPEAAPGTRHGPPDPATAVVAAKPGRAVDSGRQRDLTAAVLGLLCHGLFPVSIVDEPTFRALLRVAEPRYELPGREFFAGKAIPERCAAVREAVAQELAEAPWCGVSTDTWRSHGQNRSYVTLAAHFLAAGPGGRLSLGSRCLGTFELPDENRAEAVARLLYEALARWGIAAKVSGATTDAGRDVARACSLLDIAVRVPCLAQALEAAVQRALRLPRLAGLLARCGRLVDYFQQSPAALRLLCEKQRQRGAEPRALRSGRAGHWGGALAMLQRLREQQLAVAGALVEDSSHHHLMLEAAEWSAVDGLVQLLQPFQRVAEALAAGEGPAISAVKPLLHALLSSALAAGDTDPEEIGLAKQVIAKELAGAYQEAPAVDMFLNVATFLDPRYKRLPFLSALERQQVENRVTEEAEALLEAAGGCAGRDAEQEEDGPEEDGPPAKRPAPPATHGDGDDTGGGGAVHDMLAAVFGQADAREERRAQVAEELGNFKAQKPLGLRGDPLRWWADRRALFPLLPRLLQKYWCVAATRAPPRRLFTSAAGVVAAKRSRLAPARVDQQVFLYENSRGSGADPELEDEDEGAWGADGEPGDAGFP